MAYGEGIAYSAILLILVGTIFGLVVIINALVRKELFFYTWLMAVIFIQTLIALNL
jgi:hypothetical protein